MESGVITLKEKKKKKNAVDCMVSYFYEAGYNASEYDTSEPLLHAQVAIIADKYDCPSLYELARISFADTANTVKSDDWAAVAALVYTHTTTEVLAHVELRNSVVATVAGCHSVLRSILQDGSFEELLRSSADLATDLLLYGLHRPRKQDASGHIFLCDFCHYAHAGPSDCSNVTYTNSYGKRACPQCNCEPGRRVRQYTQMLDIYPSYPCYSCEGTHTAPHMVAKSAHEY
jgi:hypothetical protein